MNLAVIAPLVVAALGVLNFVWGFLPTFSAEGVPDSFPQSVYAMGPGYLPILLLIGGLLALGAVLPGATRRVQFPTVAVTAGGTIGVIVIGFIVGDTVTALAGGEGAEVGKGIGLILLLICGLLQTAAAVWWWLLGGGSAPGAGVATGPGAGVATGAGWSGPGAPGAAQPGAGASGAAPWGPAAQPPGPGNPPSGGLPVAPQSGGWAGSPPAGEQGPAAPPGEHGPAGPPPEHGGAGAPPSDQPGPGSFGAPPAGPTTGGQAPAGTPGQPPAGPPRAPGGDDNPEETQQLRF